MTTYVHGYSTTEARRLTDQADSLADLLHHDTAYPSGSLVLEAGCGVGAQTVRLLANSPGARIISVDRSADSLAEARRRAPGAEHVQADLMALPYPPQTFDHVFVCFVLEHVPDPAATLRALRHTLRPGGTITVIEGDHGSTYFHPASRHAQAVIDCQVALQKAAGGDALLGRQVPPLLTAAGFTDLAVSPRTVLAEASTPTLQTGFTLATFTAMMESVREEALAAGLITPADWDTGIADLQRTAEPDGTLAYTFTKATAVNPA